MVDATQSERELRLLAEGREKILAQVFKAERKGKVDSLPYQNYLVRQALEGLSARIAEDATQQNGAGAYKKFATYLGSLDPNIVALRAIQAVLSVLLEAGAADAPKAVYKQAAAAAGKAVYREYLMQHFAKLSPPLFNSLLREYARSMTSDERHLIRAFKAKFDKEGYTYPAWAFGDLEQVGNYLVFQLNKLNFIEVWSRVEKQKGKIKTVRYMQLCPELRGASLGLLDQIAGLARVAGPLIEAPLPWSAETNTGGGFHTPDMQRILAYAVQNKGVGRVAEQTVAATNYLQAVRWQVNEPVLKIVREASLRFDFGDIVGADPGPKPELAPDPSEAELKAWKGKARQWYTDRKVRAAKHRRAQKAFAEASSLAPYPAIWFAYYADFRGRQYARAGGISPQGTDLEKGLIRFAEGKPLDTPEAVFWFKVHGANKYGHDKLPLAERVKWVDDNDDAIRRAGDACDWRNADAPVQFLAWALEYAAFRAAPETALSFLPLSQDGTCNGLQNFSALLCDSVGGAAVNLIPSEAPRDIYADVATKVTERLLAMPASKFRDAWLAHGINRKITKRTTMTLPYGCTRYACSEFVTKDYLEVVKPAEIDKADYGHAANFLSHVIWAAIGDVVVKAREVMEWLKGWAKHAASNGNAVAWETPTGLQVVSEYDREKQIRVESVAFKCRISLYIPNEGAPNLGKIANAVAPNFVHSLDASHLARVLSRAADEGITVAAIHDDFGTHARDTATLHRIIREEFVVMYWSNDILQRMADSTGYDTPPPSKGDLDIREVLSSQFFFA